MAFVFICFITKTKQMTFIFGSVGTKQMNIEETLSFGNKLKQNKQHLVLDNLEQNK